jgi:hypothetical protein
MSTEAYEWLLTIADGVALLVLFAVVAFFLVFVL